MFFLLLALTLPPQATHAKADTGREDSSCAKHSLSAIYSAEKSYHSEFDTYSESFEAIGFSPEAGECQSWQGSVRVFGSGQEFLATYTKSDTGESWTINEKKELRQDHQGRSN